MSLHVIPLQPPSAGGQLRAGRGVWPSQCAAGQPPVPLLQHRGGRSGGALSNRCAPKSRAISLALHPGAAESATAKGSLTARPQPPSVHPKLLPTHTCECANKFITKIIIIRVVERQGRDFIRLRTRAFSLALHTGSDKKCRSTCIHSPGVPPPPTTTHCQRDACPFA
jgi:hypothetical protein